MITICNLNECTSTKKEFKKTTQNYPTAYQTQKADTFIRINNTTNNQKVAFGAKKYIGLSYESAKKLALKDYTFLNYGFDCSKKADARWKSLLPEIEQAQRDRTYYKGKLSDYSKKEFDCTKEISDKKTILQEKFITPLAKKEGRVPDAIMVQGKSESSKEKIINWLKQKTLESQGIIKSITHDPVTPDITISQIKRNLEEAEFQYQQYGKRTLLHIENLEELLSNNNTINNRSAIGDFNDFFDEKTYPRQGTTIIISAKNPQNIDSAARSRFQPVVELNEIFDSSDESELSRYRGIVNEYNVEAQRGIDEYNREFPTKSEEEAFEDLKKNGVYDYDDTPGFRPGDWWSTL